MEHSGPGVTPLRDDPLPPAQGSDAEDARRAAQGDRASFERLYRGHVARIHSLARRMAGFEDAHEVTQDVFVRAWQKLGTFRGEAQFGTWLYRLAINVMLAHRGRLGTRRSRYGGADEVLDQMSSRPVSMDLNMDFEMAIGRLPEGARQVFVLHDVEGFKHEEIGQMLGISSGTSKAQLHRARMLLRRTLGRS
jgi:RNA polymerase sigma-70 factor (ECF subfamily)